MDIPELSNEQRRQLIDAQQLFEAWRPVALELNSRRMLYWNTSKGVRYLYSKRNGVRTILGRETPELAQMKADHDARGKRLRQLIRPLSLRMERMAPVNRALRIGRLPALPARILRSLDDRNLLGAGGLLGLLRDVDQSFEAHYGYNATNSDGYIVDLITPDDDDIPTRMVKGTDIEATRMEGSKWLLDSPRFEQVIVGGDGIPLRIVTPEPRTFALHKLWLSRLDSRQPLKRPRDEAQARLVAHLAKTFLGLPFNAADMPWLPKNLANLIRELR